MLSRRLFMRLAMPLLPVAILLLGCGGNLIFINLDMDSFMPVEDRSFYYILPALPGPPFVEDSPISDIETPEGINEVFDLKSMTLDISVELRDDNWTPGVIVNLGVHVFLDDQKDDATSFWQEENRLLSLSGPHTAGTDMELSDTIDVADFLELFQENEMLYMGIRFTLEKDVASAPGLIDGTAIISELQLHIEAREAMF